MAGSGGGVKGDGKTVADKEDGGELGKVCQEVVDIATEKLIGSIVQVSKKELFSS
jgi:sporulation protein YlmC with PRC-barrel domain